MRQYIIIGVLIFIQCGCTDSQRDYSERVILKEEEGYKYISRSYPNKKLDSIWEYDLDGQLKRVYTGDSLLNCYGGISGFRPSGDLHYTCHCLRNVLVENCVFYDKSGEIFFIDLYSSGHLYQRLIPESGDTAKWLIPIIEIEPRLAYVHDTIYVRADYILDGIDTTGWDYFLHFDFIGREKIENKSPIPSVPYEKFIEKYDNEQIEVKFGFLVPGEYVMYGYTLAINRETGDSVSHIGISDEFLTVLDSTSVEL